MVSLDPATIRARGLSRCCQRKFFNKENTITDPVSAKCSVFVRGERKCLLLRWRVAVWEERGSRGVGDYSGEREMEEM